MAAWQQGAEVDDNVPPPVLELKYQQVYIDSHICQLHRIRISIVQNLDKKNQTPS